MLSGCDEVINRGWLPSEPNITNYTDSIISLWVNSWIALLVVGLIVWGLILWCIFAYRQRNKDDLPPQFTYHLPLEILYTTLPFLLLSVFFFYTNKVQQNIDTKFENPDVIIDAYGKQWSWDFNYVKEDTYSQGVQTNLDGNIGARERTPILYLPVNKSVEIRLHSRDVIHSFWVPSFLQKRDMIPGTTTYISLIPKKQGIYDGKCAELCGEFHSEMLFRVEVLDIESYKQKINALKNAGNKGQIGDEYNRTTIKKETNNKKVGE